MSTHTTGTHHETEIWPGLAVVVVIAKCDQSLRLLDESEDRGGDWHTDLWEVEHKVGAECEQTATLR